MYTRILNKLKSIKVKLANTLWFYTPTAIANRKKLLQLKDKFKNKRCFVMANGPSLLACDLTLLKDEITIGSNAQFLIWDKMGFVPTFFSIEDALVAEDRQKEVNKLKNTTKIFPKDLSKFLKLDENTLYINFLRNYKEFPLFSDDFENKVYWGGTVSFLNIQLAYYLGCSEIYLIGFDNSYKIPDKTDNVVITSEGDDLNHIHPDYYGKGYRWHDPNIARMEMAYAKSREFLEAKGIKIYNATIGGSLHVFERVAYADLFEANVVK